MHFLLFHLMISMTLSHQFKQKIGMSSNKRQLSNIKHNSKQGKPKRKKTSKKPRSLEFSTLSEATGHIFSVTQHTRYELGSNISV